MRSRELVEIGERIRQRRKDSHLSQEAFAEKAGISVNTVSRIEGGQAAMSVEIFSKIVAILEADANELLGKSKGKLQGKPYLENAILPYVGAETQRAGNCAPDDDSAD